MFAGYRCGTLTAQSLGNVKFTGHLKSFSKGYEVEEDYLTGVNYPTSDDDRDYISKNAPIQVPRCCFSPGTGNPAAFGVNQLSRSEALRFYSKAFNEPEFDGDGYPVIYFNWDMDTAMCVCETFGIGGYYERPFRKELAGPVLLNEFSRRTRNNLKFLMLSPEDFNQFESEDFRVIFPALKELDIICNGRNNPDARRQAIDYDLVTEYKVFLAYDQKFPGHTNPLYQEPFRRYLDKTTWLPAHQEQNITGWVPGNSDRKSAISRYPGVIPIDKDFILKFQEAPIKIEVLRGPNRVQDIANFQAYYANLLAQPNLANTVLVDMYRGRLGWPVQAVPAQGRRPKVFTDHFLGQAGVRDVRGEAIRFPNMDDEIDDESDAAELRLLGT